MPPPPWNQLLRNAIDCDSFRSLESFLDLDRQTSNVFPSEDSIWAALEDLGPSDIRAVILGQDPYHGPGQAHGLSFSVPPGVKFPPSLRNIFREYSSDLGLLAPTSGCLLKWKREGVLMLNSCLTVRAGAPGSHAGRGWEPITDAIMSVVNDVADPAVFILWGVPAQSKARLINSPRHTVLTAPHPSPLSAHRGYFGSKPFSKCNGALVAAGRNPVDWELTNNEVTFGK